MPVVAERPPVRELAGVGGVRVWGVDLSQPASVVEAMATALCDAERARAARLGPGPARRRFIVARASLRILLAETTGIPAGRLDLTAEPGGKPFLKPGGIGVAPEFNLSHARDLALIGIGARRRIGIDLAWVKGAAPIDTMAQRFFSDPERAWLAAAPIAERRTCCCQIWVRKEAYLKGRGEGISPRIHETDFAELGPSRGATPGSPPRDQDQWMVEDLVDLPPGYVASIAVARHPS